MNPDVRSSYYDDDGKTFDFRPILSLFCRFFFFDKKIVWKIHFWHSICQKMLNWGMFRHYIDPEIIVRMHHWIYLVETLRFSSHMTIFWILIFWAKMWRNWSGLKNFVIIFLMTWFFIRVHILSLGLDEYSERFFCIFRGFLRKTYILPPGKMSLAFSEIRKCQNHGLFEGIVMGGPKDPTILFWSGLSDNLSQIYNTQKVIYHLYTVHVPPADNFFPRIYFV